MRNLLKIVEGWGSGCSAAGFLLPAGITFFALILICLLQFLAVIGLALLIRQP